MLPLVERDCCDWMLPLVERNIRSGLPLVEFVDQSFPLVDSGDQGPMDISNHIFFSIVERDGWRVLHVCLTYQHY